MRVPYSIQGVLFVPAFFGMMLVLKATCPVPTGSGCFAEQMALPAFLPLAIAENFMGADFLTFTSEVVLVLAYWMLVGFLFGIIFDLWGRGKDKNGTQMTNVQ